MRRSFVASAILAMIAFACGPAGVDVRAERPEGFSLVTQVADTADNSGDGVSLATDATGNPHLAYLSFLASKQNPDDPEPAVDVLGVHVPAVKHAHFVGGSWTRSVVRDTPLEGEEVDEQPPEITGEDDTAIVLDADGVHHIAWTASGGGPLYSTNQEGAFSEPEQVSPAEAAHPAIAVGENGSLWVAFFRGDLVFAAKRGRDGWTTENVGTGLPTRETPRSIGLRVAGDTPLVAYADDEGVKLARRTQGGGWASELVDGDGGLGISLALDQDRNPHVSYYAGNEVRHAHSIDGSAWDISTVGETSGPDPESATSIALDEAGIHHVAWDDGERIAYANNEGGEFEEEEIPGSAGGVQPAIGAGPEGVAAIGWYQPKEELLKVSIRSEEEPLLAIPGESPIVGPGGTPSAECEPEGTELTITAAPGAAAAGFDKDCLAAPTGEAFTIEFINDDDPQLHNVGIYTEQGGDELFAGEVITAPATTTYNVDPLEEGTLFFQCDIHPGSMIGTFVVA